MDDPLSSMNFWERREPSPMDRGQNAENNVKSNLLSQRYEENMESSEAVAPKPVPQPIADQANPFMRLLDITSGIRNTRDAASNYYNHSQSSRTATAGGAAYSKLHNDYSNDNAEESHIGLLLRSDREGVSGYWQSKNWDAVSNLDEFFERLYIYYHEKGFTSILLKRIVNLVTLAFTVVLSTFLIGYVEWSKIIDCRDLESCEDNLSDYLSSFGDPSHSLAKRWFVVLYILACLAYWLWTCAALVPTLQKNWATRKFYEQKLGIQTRQLQTMEWSAVVERLIDLQESGQFTFQVNGTKLSAQNIAMRIMRKENFMIALVNHNVLPIGSQWFGNEWFLGKSLELSLNFAIFDNLFDESFQIRRAFLQDSRDLQQRLKVVGIANLVMLPFSIGFVVVFYFLRYAEEFHSKKNYLGPRWWSPHALWQFREINELPHIFDRRMYASLSHAEAYVKQFPSPVPSTIASGVSFVAGGLLGILLLFTFIDESILLYVKVYDRNLLWYVALLSAVLAISRTLIPQQESKVFNPNAMMRKVVAFTHYLPDHWRARCHTFDVRDAFCDLFQYKFLLLIRELFCILTTPFILLVVMPNYVDDVVEFIRSHAVPEEGMGHVCLFSRFDLEAHGDERYGTSKDLADTREGQGGPSSRRQSKKLCMFGGKLEKSLLNFRSNYPGCQESAGKALADRLSHFQQESVNEVSRGSVSSDLAGSILVNSTQSLGASPDHPRQRMVDLLGPLDEGLLDQHVPPGNQRVPSAGMAQSQLVGEARGDASSARMAKSIPALQQGFFDNQASAVLPLQSVRFPNAENYFYWLEEYRDASSARPMREEP